MSTFSNMNKEDILEVVTKQPFELRPIIGLDHNQTFGIEIEFEDALLASIKNIGKWKLEKELIVSKEDNNNIFGGELISPILTDNFQTWEDINSKCKKLVKSGANISNWTGGHIHIGSQILGDNPDNIRRLLKKWELFENIIYYFSYGDSNTPRLSIKAYANPIGLRLKQTRESLRGYQQFKKFYHWMKSFRKNLLIKNEGISFKNYRGHEVDDNNTIEIRCPNGSLNPVIWQNNINFFTKLLLTSKEEYCDEELLDYLLSKKEDYEYELKSFQQIDIDKAILLSDMVFDKDIDKLLFLKQYLKLFQEEKNKNHSV